MIGRCHVNFRRARRGAIGLVTGSGGDASDGFPGCHRMRRWRSVARAERRDPRGTNRLRTAEKTATKRCRPPLETSFGNGYVWVGRRCANSFPVPQNDARSIVGAFVIIRSSPSRPHRRVRGYREAYIRRRSAPSPFCRCYFEPIEPHSALSGSRDCCTVLAVRFSSPCSTS